MWEKLGQTCIFWKEVFGQGEDSLGWGRWMEPAAFSGPETVVVRIGAGAGVQAGLAGLSLGLREAGGQVRDWHVQHLILVLCAQMFSLRILDQFKINPLLIPNPVS